MAPLHKRDSKSKWSSAGELTSLAMTLAICVIIGLLAGQWIGRKLGGEDLGVAVGVFVGVFAAGYELTRVVKRLNRETRRNAEADNDPPD